MTAISDYLEDALIEHIFGNTNYTRPATIYLALFTVAPTDAGGGTEVVGNNYARLGLDTGASSAWTRTNNVASNTANAEFAQASGGNWGDILAVGLFDASSGGNLLFHGPLAATKTVNDGDIFRFNAGDLTITLD